MLADCQEVQRKLEAIRSKKIGKRTKKTRKEMERLGIPQEATPAPSL
ncbi:MAG: hypothetical protein HFF12_11245, partial [Angelakisella sp.]|nr:hypothetical protein [Angelakisella sp.]